MNKQTGFRKQKRPSYNFGIKICQRKRKCEAQNKQTGKYSDCRITGIAVRGKGVGDVTQRATDKKNKAVGGRKKRQSRKTRVSIWKSKREGD